MGVDTRKSPGPWHGPPGLLGRGQRIALILGVFTLVLVFFGWQAVGDVEALMDRHAARAEHHAGLAVMEVERYLAERRHRVGLFAEVHRAPIERLARHPADRSTLEDLEGELQRWFPDAFALAVTGPAGEVLAGDIEGRAAGPCRQDIRAFGGEASRPPILHPRGHPFAVTVARAEDQAGQAGFCVGFRPVRLSRILNAHEIYGYRLFLLREDRDGRIEVGSTGARDDLARSPRLTPAERDAIIARRPVAGSGWSLVAVPEFGYLEERRKTLFRGFLRAAGLTGLLALGLLLLLDQRERQLGRSLDHNRRLRRMSLLDPLTGLANRTALDRALARAWRHAGPVAAVMVDVDHFKEYNDSLGHGEGDLCLRRLAELFSAATRQPRDVVARYGGEEFVLLLPGTDLRAAEEVAERLRESVEAAAIPHPGNGTCDHVTVSLGVAATGNPANGLPEELIAAADRALYRAKAGGRNRVESEQPEDG